MKISSKKSRSRCEKSITEKRIPICEKHGKGEPFLSGLGLAQVGYQIYFCVICNKILS